MQLWRFLPCVAILLLLYFISFLLSLSICFICLCICLSRTDISFHSKSLSFFFLSTFPSIHCYLLSVSPLSSHLSLLPTFLSSVFLFPSLFYVFTLRLLSLFSNSFFYIICLLAFIFHSVSPLQCSLLSLFFNLYFFLFSLSTFSSFFLHLLFYFLSLSTVIHLFHLFNYFSISSIHLLLYISSIWCYFSILFPSLSTFLSFYLLLLSHLFPGPFKLVNKCTECIEFDPGETKLQFSSLLQNLVTQVAKKDDHWW